MNLVYLIIILDCLAQKPFARSKTYDPSAVYDSYEDYPSVIPSISDYESDCYPACSELPITPKLHFGDEQPESFEEIETSGKSEEPQMEVFNSEDLPLADDDSSEEKQNKSVSKPWHKQALQRENDFRRRLAAEPRKLDDKLTKKAQKRAEKLAQKCENEENNFPTKELSENISVVNTEGFISFLFGNDNGFVNEGIDMWYNENRKYNCDRQVLLKDLGTSNYPKSVERYMALANTMTTTVGYGFSRNRACNTAYVVAMYGGQDEEIFKEAEGGRGELKLSEFVPCPKRSSSRRGSFFG